MRRTLVHHHYRYGGKVPVVQHTRQLEERPEREKFEKPDWAKKEKIGDKVILTSITQQGENLDYKGKIATLDYVPSTKDGLYSVKVDANGKELSVFENQFSKIDKNYNPVEKKTNREDLLGRKDYYLELKSKEKINTGVGKEPIESKRIIKIYPQVGTEQTRKDTILNIPDNKFVYDIHKVSIIHWDEKDKLYHHKDFNFLNKKDAINFASEYTETNKIPKRKPDYEV